MIGSNKLYEDEDFLAFLRELDLDTVSGNKIKSPREFQGFLSSIFWSFDSSDQAERIQAQNKKAADWLELALEELDTFLLVVEDNPSGDGQIHTGLFRAVEFKIDGEKHVCLKDMLYHLFGDAG